MADTQLGKKTRSINQQFNDYIFITENRKRRLINENKMLANSVTDINNLICHQEDILAFQQGEIAKFNPPKIQFPKGQSNDVMTKIMTIKSKYIDAVLKANAIITKYNALVDFIEVSKPQMQMP